jgi:hypothetical protein
MKSENFLFVSMAVKLPVPLYKVHTRLRVLRRVLGRIFGPRRQKIAGQYYIKTSLIICTLHLILFG